MTRAELRALVQGLIFDRAQAGEPAPFSTTLLDTFINAALQQVANLALTVQEVLFLTSATTTLNGSGRLGLLSLSGATYPRVKRLLQVWRTDAGLSAPRRCEIVRIARASLQVEGTAQAVPKAGVYNETVALLDPPPTSGGVTPAYEVHYLHGIPDMSHDTNTPGQTGSGNTGTANLLPIEYHPLIAYRAAVIALKAERADWQGLAADYQEMKAELVAGLGRQSDTSEDG